ncbi:MAG: hypothetical protein U1E54_00580 [Candidatus Levybacteria bacterium]|nr:hypothetical protein [Candidatus Levybacteria bacterium]
MDKNKRQQESEISSPKMSQNPENMSAIFTKNLFIFLIVAAILGGITGYALSFNKGGGDTGNSLTSGSIDSSKITKGMVVGSNDTKTFKDTASGTLKNGGINGEGKFHLVRTGGDSQNVYVISSSVDLSKFVDKKIKIWGQTQTAQYAGWLMDVGRVEVLE